MMPFVTDKSARSAAIKIAAVYWALLIFGMVLYTSLRTDALKVLEPMWAGTVAGTALGQVLAVRRYRVWLAALIIIAVALFVLPHAPPELGGKRLWMAYLPAALCGYWSLGDRTTLAAFWFPAVIWMLSILDGTHANAMPTGNGLVLFAGLAILFVVFLRVREERRVALWRTVAREPLATLRPQQIVKERAGVQLARGAWGVFVTGLGFIATAWLAPSLWKQETHDGKHQIVNADSLNIGVPCCPAGADDQPTHTRVKEYFDVGRADVEHHVDAPKDCRVCDEETPTVADITDNPNFTGAQGGDYYVQGEGAYVDGNGAVTYRPSTIHYGDYRPPAGGSWTPSSGVPTVGEQGVPSQAADPWSGAPPTAGTQLPSAPSQVPSAPSQYPSGGSITTNVPAPQVVPQAAPDISPAPVATNPVPVPTAPRPHLSSNTSPVVHDGHATPARPDGAGGFQLLHWIAVIVASMFFIQVISLLLRPLRRALVLRHLRRPFWTETVDQRVSNAWQLVLVGLRDAGWRSDSGEAPREVAKRVGVDGVEDCATILDRARHGVRVDREDLEKMVSSADVAYRGARTKVGRMSRAVSWLRWPLV